MRGLLWIGIALLAVSPLVAQEDEEGGFFGGFGPGDESDLPQAETRGRSEQRQGPNPVDELDAILSKGGQPLSADQKKAIQALVERQVEEIRQAAEQRRAAFQEGAAPQRDPGQDGASGQAAASDPGGSAGAGEPARVGPGDGSGGPGQRAPAGSGGAPGPRAQGGRGGPFPPPGESGLRGQSSDAARREEERFIANFLPVLTPEQTIVWNNFRKDQVRKRGGYPALKLALEEAGTPPTPEQETQLQEIFRTYDEQKRQLQRAAGPGGQLDAAKKKEADEQYIASLVKALNADQRKALLEWRRNSQAD